MSRGKKPEQEKRSLEQEVRRKKEINTHDARYVEEVTRGKAMYCVRQGKVKGGGIE